MTISTRKTCALWPALVLGLSTAGCGGGGAIPAVYAPVPSGVAVLTPVPAPAPAAGPVPAYYLPAVASSNTATSATLLGVNRYAPATPALSASLSDVNGAPGSVHTIAAYAIDAAAHRLDYLGESRAYYVGAGRIYRGNLAGSASQTPTQLSSIANACYVEHVYQGNAAASDNWVGVYTAGADGQCATAGDNVYAMVRDSYVAATAPRYFPTGTAHAEIVADETGATLGFIALVSGTFKFLDWASMAAIGDVANGSGGGFFFFSWIGELATQKTAWLLVNGSPTSVRALTYSATGATLSPSLYSFTGRHPTSIPGLGGWDAGYFADNNKLMKLGGTAAATPLATLASGGSITAMGATTNFIVLRFVAADGSVSVWSVPKAGGAPVQLGIGWTSAGGATTPRALDAVGDTLWTTRALGSGLVDVVAINADGSGLRTVLAGVAPVGTLKPAAADPAASPVDSLGFGVNDRQRSPATPDAASPLGGQIDALLYCQPAAGRSDCAGAALTQLDVATGAATVLGTLPTVTGGSTLAARADGTSGQPFTLAVISGSARDVYYAVGGTAGSLSAVAKSIPAASAAR